MAWDTFNVVQKSGAASNGLHTAKNRNKRNHVEGGRPLEAAAEPNSNGFPNPIDWWCPDLASRGCW